MNAAQIIELPTLPALTVPNIRHDDDALTAAFAYAEAGWFVLPVRRGTKNPGSVVGSNWQTLSSRDPLQITAWFAGTDHGIALHAGRSGAVVFDVDHPDQLPDVLQRALREHRPPMQNTRPGNLQRGHALFRQPTDRIVGNGNGQLGKTWGEVRGLNGVIIAAPSEHPEAEGAYAWVRTGPVPALPQALSDLLPGPAADAALPANDDAVGLFLDSATSSEHPALLAAVTARFARDVAGGASRHACAVDALTQAMREAAAGFYPARTAHDRLREAFLASVSTEGCGVHQGAARRGPEAAAEWSGIAAWAVGQAMAVDPAQQRAATAQRAPRQSLREWLLEEDDTPSPEPPTVPAPPAEVPLPEHPRERTLTLKPASAFVMRPVRWLWDGRIACGALSLLAGREGIGKSTAAYWIAAALTRGTLPGTYVGTPTSVLVAATEDSWEHTIVPRLTAAGADLDRVLCAEVTTSHGIPTGISLPADLPGIEAAVPAHQVSLILLDPLVSRLSSTLDTHKDADVRQALEPLVQVADKTGAAILGLIHVNKSSSTDPLNTIMASRAFTAVARSVLFVVVDPDDESVRLFGTPKNNLGRTDLPTLAFRIQGVQVTETIEGPVWSSKIVWGDSRTQSIRDVLEHAAGDSETRTATTDATAWLSDYLTVNANAESQQILHAANNVGHSRSAVQRARKALHLEVTSEGFPRRTYWALPQSFHSQSSQSLGRVE